MEQTVFKTIRHLDLLFGKCKQCAEIQILGFYQQLDWVINHSTSMAEVSWRCKVCGQNNIRVTEVIIPDHECVSGCKICWDIIDNPGD